MCNSIQFQFPFFCTTLLLAAVFVSTFSPFTLLQNSSGGAGDSSSRRIHSMQPALRLPSAAATGHGRSKALGVHQETSGTF